MLRLRRARDPLPSGHPDTIARTLTDRLERMERSERVRTSTYTSQRIAETEAMRELFTLGAPHRDPVNQPSSEIGVLPQMRKILIIGAVVASLLVPSAALAATSSGATTESLTLASSISMTVTSAIVYTGGGINKSATVALTAATDNPAGLVVTVSTSGEGAGKITRASRSIAPFTATGVSVTTTSYTDMHVNADYTLITSPRAEPGLAANIPFGVDTTEYTPGTFTGSLSFLATEN